MENKLPTTVAIFFRQKECPNCEDRDCGHKAVFDVKEDGTLSIPIIICTGNVAFTLDFKKLNEPAVIAFTKLGKTPEEFFKFWN